MGVGERIEQMLWRKGFVYAPLRLATRDLLIFSAIFFAAGVILFSWTSHVFWAGTAAVLSCWNFYTLARCIQHSLPAAIPAEDKRGASTARHVKKGLRLQTYLRLFITGFFVYLALVQFQVSPIALAAGLSVPVTITPLSLIFRR